MRELHVSCQKNKKFQLPVFPPRKLFGSTDEAFIQKRKKELENYYNTILKTINIEELPDLLSFLNTHKPVKKVIKPPAGTSSVPNKPMPQQTPQTKDKQAQLKKVFEEIVGKTCKEMVESNEYDTEIEDETRRKFNQEFQKLKLDLKSPILDQMVVPKGDKQNDTDFWSAFFNDQHEGSIKKLEKAAGDIENILKESNQCQIQFVVPM